MNGYVIRGIDDELLLVIRSMDEELIHQIIKKISSMREKEIKALAEDLEMDLLNGHTNGSNGKPKPKDKGSGSRGVRRNGRKTPAPQHRAQ